MLRSAFTGGRLAAASAGSSWAASLSFRTTLVRPSSSIASDLRSPKRHPHRRCLTSFRMGCLSDRYAVGHAPSRPEDEHGMAAELVLPGGVFVVEVPGFGLDPGRWARAYAAF